MKKLTVAIIAGASAFAAVSALAGHHEGMKEDHMAKMEAKLEAKFVEVDANADGNVSGDEFMAYKMAEAQKEWDTWSAQAGDDAMVSLAEAKVAMAEKMAAKMAEKEAKMKEHHGKMEDGASMDGDKEDGE